MSNSNASGSLEFFLEQLVLLQVFFVDQELLELLLRIIEVCLCSESIGEYGSLVVNSGGRAFERDLPSVLLLVI